MVDKTVSKNKQSLKYMFYNHGLIDSSEVGIFLFLAMSRLTLWTLPACYPRNTGVFFSRCKVAVV